MFGKEKKAEDKKKELFEYLEFLRRVDGLEFDEDGNLTN